MRLVRSYFHVYFYICIKCHCFLLLKVISPMMSVLLQQEQEVCCTFKWLNNIMLLNPLDPPGGSK